MNPATETLIVRTLQEKLSSVVADDGRPYYFDRDRGRPAEIDNDEGPITRDAVRRFKRERLGFADRPLVSHLTWSELAEIVPMDSAPDAPVEADVAAPWLVYGMQYLGEREVKGPGHNLLIVGWGRKAGIGWWNNDEDAWCAVFVNGCLVAMNYPSTKSALARSFMDYGKPCTLKRGAIVVFPRGRNPLYGHVGIVTEVHGDGTFTVLNGNVNDAVRLSRRRVGEILPGGIRWPVKP